MIYSGLINVLQQAREFFLGLPCHVIVASLQHISHEFNKLRRGCSRPELFHIVCHLDFDKSAECRGTHRDMLLGCSVDQHRIMLIRFFEEAYPIACAEKESQFFCPWTYHIGDALSISNIS